MISPSLLTIKVMATEATPTRKHKLSKLSPSMIPQKELEEEKIINLLTNAPGTVRHSYSQTIHTQKTIKRISSFAGYTYSRELYSPSADEMSF